MSVPKQTSTHTHSQSSTKPAPFTSVYSPSVSHNVLLSHKNSAPPRRRHRPHRLHYANYTVKGDRPTVGRRKSAYQFVLLAYAGEARDDAAHAVVVDRAIVPHQTFTESYSLL